VRVREDGQAARVDDPRGAELVDELEDDPRALHVHLIGARVADTHLVPSRQMERAVHALHRRADAGSVGDVSRPQEGPRRLERPSAAGIAHERHDLVPRVQELPDELTAQEAGPARHEVPHLSCRSPCSIANIAAAALVEAPIFA
jgi:hypothetical protein